NVTEYVVRVPKNTTKKYNIMAFNAADKVNFATWNQARLERDLSNKKIYQEEEMPESGAGSEFNRKLREEARRKKYGIVLKEFRPEDQPWLLRVNGKSGRKFKGIKKGGVTENTSYYIFTQCPDGAFEAFPVHNWYNFTPLARHRTLTAEEAEEEWERRNKVLNHFSIMQQRRLKDQDQDEEDEEKEKRSRKKASELRIHDLEDDLEMSSDDSEASGEEGEAAPKAKKKAPPAKGGRKKKKKKGSDDEAFEDSDDGDFEGQEVDYMSDGSSSSQDELEGKPKVTQQEEGPKGVDEQSESSEESEEEKPPEEDKEEEEEKKAPTPQEKKRRKGGSPPRCPGAPLPEPLIWGGAGAGDVQVTEDAVRRYLTRKPMTTKDLLKKFQTKKTGLSSEQTVNVLAQILKRLNPERKMISDKMHFSLKE
uniref:Transcription initiation factor IIF subunit alpha n=1 Tax=Panthera tigris altaica TaxID=74533 RepID=A0A8C9M1K2_PANTA